jgi:hypothetical protein
MEIHSHGLSTDGVIALSSEELVDQTYDYIRLLDDDLDVVSDALYFLVGEILERFAQDEARAELTRIYSDKDDPEDMNDLLDSIAGMRRRQAARLLHATLEPCPDEPLGEQTEQA